MDESAVELPDSLLLSIFAFLDREDLGRVARVCRQWRRVTADDSLWRQLFVKHFQQESTLSIDEWPLRPVIAETWKEEFCRLRCGCPRMERTVIITGHNDEVLHVSFSNDGTKFATTSKEPIVKVWGLANAGDSDPIFECDFREFDWNDTKYSTFSPSDTLLLVCGSKYGLPIERGRVALIQAKPTYRLLQWVVIDSLVAWISDRTFVGGILHFNETTYESTTQLCVFDGFGDILDTQENSEVPPSVRIQGHTVAYYRSRPSIFDCYVAVSSDFSDSAPCEAEVGSVGKGEEEDVEESFFSNDSRFNPVLHCRDRVKPSMFYDLFKGKQLLCISGQLGDEVYKLRVKSNPPENRSPSDLNDTMVQFQRLTVSDEAQFTVPPKLKITQQKLEMRALITGICLARDGRHLFVNCRPWNKLDDGNFDSLDPSDTLEVRVVDLKTFKDTGIRYKGHMGFDTIGPCFVYLDVSEDYVASGSTDKKAYLWDRHYRCKLDAMRHVNGIVNSVAFCPTNQQCLVSVGDDCCIKIFRARHPVS